MEASSLPTAVAFSERSLPESTSAAGASIRTLIVGSGPRAARCAERLRIAGRTLVGALDTHAMPDLSSLAPAVPWLGPIEDLADIAHRHAVDEVIVALPIRSGYDNWQAVRRCGLEIGLPVSFDLDLFEGLDPAASVRRDGTLEVWVNRHPANHPPRRQIKRALDLVLGSLALLLAVPVLIAAALAVRFSSPGPVLFRQTRIGRNGRPFTMLKFRTMVEDAERRRSALQSLNDAGGVLFKIFRDPRVTPIGRLLRQTSIDELPQLFNVLRGEMSLVGPRPIPKWAVEKMADTRFHRRFSMLPGITGLWQVRDRRQDFEHMARLDIEYVDGWSLWLDLRLLAGTLPAILGGRNAY